MTSETDTGNIAPGRQSDKQKKVFKTKSKKETNPNDISKTGKCVIIFISCIILPAVAALIYNRVCLTAHQPECRISHIFRNRYKNMKEIDFEQYLPNNMKPNQIPFIVPNVQLPDQYNVPDMDHLLKIVNESTRIAITGRPGVGKSTLARYIAKLWANGEHLQQFTTLFHICLGRTSEAITDLEQIIEEECQGLIHPKGQKQELSELLNKIEDTEGENILFLLDSFDEYIPNHAKRKNEFVLSLIQRNVLPKSAVIVMSRPRSVDDHLFTKIFELTGFRQSDIKMSLSHLEDPLRISIENYFENNPNVKKLCYLPLHMTMIIYLASLEKENDPLSQLDSETKIFKNFLDLTIAHYQERHSLGAIRLVECFEHPSLSKNDSLCSLFLSICELAFNATFHNQQTFSSNEIQKLSVSTVILEKLSLLNIKKENRRSGHVDVFSFSHQKFRDFMSAYHLILLPTADQQRIIEKYANELNFRDLIWKFYFGLLGEQNNDTALYILFQCYVENGGYELLPTKYYEIDLYPLAYAFETGIEHDKFIELLDYAHIIGIGNNHSLQINVKEPINVLSFLNIEESNTNASVSFVFMEHILEWIIIRVIKIKLQIKSVPAPDPTILCSNFSQIQVNDSKKYEYITQVNIHCSQMYNSTSQMHKRTAINSSYVAILELEYFHPMKEAIDPRIVSNMLQASGIFKFAVGVRTEMIDYLNTTQNSTSSSRKNKLLKIILSNHTYSSSKNLTYEELSFMHIWNYFDKWYKKILSKRQYSFNFSDLRRLKIQHSLFDGYIDTENLCHILKYATKLEELSLPDNGIEQIPAFLDLFQSLPHLKVLDLTHTGVNLHWLAKGFKNIKTLQELKISGRVRYNIQRESWQKWDQCSQNETFGNQLIHLKKLEVLDLSDGSEEAFDYEKYIHGLRYLHNLKRLNLSHNFYLWQDRQDKLAQSLLWLALDKLEYLDLSHNNIHKLSPQLTGALSRIKEVNLSHNGINFPVSELIGVFKAVNMNTKLKRIDLSNNLLCGDNQEFQSFLKSFSMSTLKEVNLLNNHIYFSLESNHKLKYFSSSSKRKAVHVNNYNYYER